MDRNRIGVCGDSAGATLSVISCMMARDCGAAVRPAFQLLVYPWLDGRNCSDSYNKYTDTPMWNSTLSRKVGPIINPGPASIPLAYRSPVEADSHAGFHQRTSRWQSSTVCTTTACCTPRLLRDNGIPVEFHEVKGAMHGLDTVFNAPTSQKMLAKRVVYIRRMFGG